MISAVTLLINPAGVEAPRPVVPGMAMPAGNARALLGRAAEAAGNRAFTAPRPGQWAYIEMRMQGVGTTLIMTVPSRSRLYYQQLPAKIGTANPGTDPIFVTTDDLVQPQQVRHPA
ncbi:hypothetical protein ACIHFD_04085 [Nonomuraea sp. NPDC051941]|uniref:hypothetical protein n=1 Tax=Nonomuraea sp. NPDC051941 TaxID=3364373 RepID=UPI0037C9EEDA